MRLSGAEERRIEDIRQRYQSSSNGPWRNTIRRESPEGVARAIRSARCSEVVVNAKRTPKAENVVCWMGPAAVETGDDLLDAAFIAHAKQDIPWLLSLVAKLQG